jgi:hypothetical protein
MTLLFFTACLLAVVLWFWHRDRRYLKKELRDIVSPEMQTRLNLPGPDKKFEELLKKKITEKKPDSGA